MDRIGIDMRVIFLVVLLLTGIAASSSSAQAAIDRTVGCGGFPLPYGTTFGSAGPSRSRQQPRSVISVAAVTPTGSSDLHPRAWMVWDERGMAWLALKKTSPMDLQRLWLLSGRPTFDGQHFRVQFTPIKVFPNSYTLIDCPHALP